MRFLKFDNQYLQSFNQCHNCRAPIQSINCVSDSIKFYHSKQLETPNCRIQGHQSYFIDCIIFIEALSSPLTFKATYTKDNQFFFYIKIEINYLSRIVPVILEN